MLSLVHRVKYSTLLLLIAEKLKDMEQNVVANVIQKVTYH